AGPLHFANSQDAQVIGKGKAAAIGLHRKGVNFFGNQPMRGPTPALGKVKDPSVNRQVALVANESRTLGDLPDKSALGRTCRFPETEVPVGVPRSDPLLTWLDCNCPRFTPLTPRYRDLAYATLPTLLVQPGLQSSVRRCCNQGAFSGESKLPH